MKAIVYQKYGSIDHLKLQEIEKPVPKNKEVRIKVHAAGLNSWDWDLLKGTTQGRIFGLFKPKWKILGADVAGIVESVGSDVTDFKIGDEVFGDLSEGSWGCFAEYVCANEKELALKPTNLSFEAAAAVPQAGFLAIQGLFNKRSIEKGQKILINGAGGGVGTFALQIAKNSGAEVTVVDKGIKLAQLKALGADHVIDYTKTNYTKTGQQYDLIIDNVTHQKAAAYSRVLASNGIFNVIGGKISSMLNILIVGGLISKTSQKRIGLLAYKPNRTDLLKLTTLIENGKIEPIIDKVFSLAEAPDAFRYYEKGDFVGKIVIKVI